MSSLKPVIHGRDHLPGGADPIPGLTEITPYVPDHAEGRYQAASGSVTVGSGTGVAVDFDYVAGAAILDLTAPAAPTVTTKGMYVVEVTYSPLDILTVGAIYRGLLQFHAVRLKTMYSVVTYGDLDLPSASNTPATYGHVSLTGVLAPADTITFQIENGDSASRDFSAPHIEVTRLYALA